MLVQRKTEQQYWDDKWEGKDVLPPINPARGGLDGYYERRQGAFFDRLFERHGVRSGQSIIEIGCGGSRALPFFALRYGLKAHGLDTAAHGVALSEAMARKAGVDTPISECDVFDPSTEMLGAFDVVYSDGVAEHFDPTKDILLAAAALAKPNGLIITRVPNMNGIVGFVQKYANPPVYDQHIALTPTQLGAAHKAIGLELLESAYWLTINMSVVNFAGPGARAPQNLALRLASWTSKVVWILEGLGFPEIPNRVTSPMVFSVARKPLTHEPD